MKPLARGYIHQAAFFIAISACIILISQSHGARALTSSIIYSLTLTLLYGVSALYHYRCPMWSRRNYLLMKRIDHAAIFALIAGSATPICLLGLKGTSGLQLLSIMWTMAVIGMLTTIVWIHAPKWARAFLYLVTGWLALSYLPEINSSLGITNMRLLLIGGIIYTIGALVYAFKRPNPFPKVFGYHEIFHTFIVIASGFHFRVIYNLAT